MDNFIPQNGTLWAALASSVVVAVGMIYKAFRMVKGDLRDDKAVQNVDKFVETQTAKIKDLEDQLKLLSDRMEILQKERATAIALSGQLQGELNGWKLRVDDFKEQRDQKDKELQNVRDEVIKLKLQNENLLKINGFYKNENHTENNGDH